MNARQFDGLLFKLDACSEARKWARGKTLHKVWSTCRRADWLLWLAGRMKGKPGWHTHQEIVLAACACAETALKYLPKKEIRPKFAIKVARKWANGDSDIGEIENFSRYAVYAAAASSGAEDAAYAAAYAVNSADEYGVYSAHFAAVFAAAATGKKSQKQLADIVRKHLHKPLEEK